MDNKEEYVIYKGNCFTVEWYFDEKRKVNLKIIFINYQKMNRENSFI